jgi:hypothetical protein
MICYFKSRKSKKTQHGKGIKKDLRIWNVSGSILTQLELASAAQVMANEYRENNEKNTTSK